MFFDIGWPELLLIGVVALVVIGPKDLPRALKVAGFWVRKARMLSREFQSSVDQMIREAELDEMRKDLEKAAQFDLNKEVERAVDPTGELTQSIKPPDVPDYFEEASTSATPAADTETDGVIAPPEATAAEPLAAVEAESVPEEAPPAEPEPKPPRKTRRAKPATAAGDEPAPPKC